MERRSNSKDTLVPSEDRSYGSFEKKKIDLETAIRLTGFGRYHVGLMILCGSCLTTMITESMGVSFIMPSAQCDFALTTADKGYLSGATFLGMIVSGHAWGFAADTMGRRKVLLASLWGSWTASALSSLAPNVWIFIVLRFFTGLFLSGTTSTVYAYLCEFLPSKTRTKFMIWTCGFVAIGFIMIPGVAWVILPCNFDWNFGFIRFKSWRLFVVIMGITSFVDGFVFLLYPESPKFLMSIGRKQEALEVLRNVYARNTGKNPTEYPVKDLQYEVEQFEETLGEPEVVLAREIEVKSSSRSFLRVVWRQTYPLFLHPYGRKTLLFCTLQFGIYVSSGGMYLWLPTILKLVSFDSPLGKNGSSATVCELISRWEPEVENTNETSFDKTKCIDEIRTEVYASELVVGGSYLVSYAIIGALLNVVGNRKLLVMAQLTSGLAGIGTVFARNEVLITILTAGYVVLAGTCVSVLSAAVVDLYPTELRAMAVTLALTCGRLGSSLAGNTIGISMEASCEATFIGLACIALCCGLLCTLIPRVKNSEIK